MRKLAVLTMLVATQACVLGRGPTARHTAMAIDGVLAAGGIALAVTADHSSETFVGGIADGVANSLQKDAGAIALMAGLAGLVINLALAPSPPQPDTVLHQPAVALSVAPSSKLSLAAVTLEPAP